MSRTRNNYLVGANSTWYERTGTAGFVTNADAYTFPSFAKGKFMIDVDSPGFYKDSRSGSIRNNPMSIWKIDHRPSRMIVGCRTDLYSDSYYTKVISSKEGQLSLDCSAISYGVMPVIKDGPRLRPPVEYASSISSSVNTLLDELGIASSRIADLERNAVMRAVSKETAASAAVLSTAGELGETLRLLPDTLRLLKDVMLATRGRISSILGDARTRAWIRGANLHTTPREAKLLAKGWLQCRYGFRPLIYDIRNILSAAEKLHEPRLTCRGYASNEAHAIRRSWVKLGNAPQILYANTYTDAQITCRAGTLCAVDQEIANLTVLRMGCDRLLTTAWDLVPLSFIVDWFLDISSWLGTLQPSFGLRRLSSWCTTQIDIYQKVKIDSQSPCFIENKRFCDRYGESYESSVSLLASGVANVHYVYKRRTVGVAEATLYPSYEARVNVANLTDLIAIVIGHFR